MLLGQSRSRGSICGTGISTSSPQNETSQSADIQVMGRNLIWMHVKARIDSIDLPGSAISITEPEVPAITPKGSFSAKNPKLIMNQHGMRERTLSTRPGFFEHHDATLWGIHWPDLGFRIAESCGFAFSAILTGVCSINHARRHFFLKNRVNYPSLFLPAVLNKESLSQEREELSKSRGGMNEPLQKEPFLVLDDREGKRLWRIRKAKNVERRYFSTVFADDEPGCFSAGGSMRLVDGYEGPLIRVSKEPHS